MGYSQELLYSYMPQSRIWFSLLSGIVYREEGFVPIIRYSFYLETVHCYDKFSPEDKMELKEPHKMELQIIK